MQLTDIIDNRTQTLPPTTLMEEQLPPQTSITNPDDLPDFLKSRFKFIPPKDSTQSNHNNNNHHNNASRETNNSNYQTSRGGNNNNNGRINTPRFGGGNDPHSNNEQSNKPLNFGILPEDGFGSGASKGGSGGGVGNVGADASKPISLFTYVFAIFLENFIFQYGMIF